MMKYDEIEPHRVIEPSNLCPMFLQEPHSGILGGTRPYRLISALSLQGLAPGVRALLQKKHFLTELDLGNNPIGSSDAFDAFHIFT